MEVPVLTENRHNALKLSYAVEILVKRKLAWSTPRQIAAFKEFQNLLDDPSMSSLMRRLGAEDGRDVAKDEYTYILGLLNGMFFPGEVPFTFKFYEENDAYGDCDGWSKDHYVRVRLHPFKIERLHNGPPEGSVVNDRAMSRLNTLLHEAYHAFLVVYACRKCPSVAADVDNFDGHGFAWQRIAYSMELAAHRSLGLKLTMAEWIPSGITGSTLRCCPHQRKWSAGI